MVELADVEAAREAIAGRLHRTPNFSSATLSDLTGARVSLKAELFQRTGSFKPRGVLTNLAALTPDRARAIGQAALARVLAEHTYELRGRQVHALFQEHAARVREAA